MGRGGATLLLLLVARVSTSELSWEHMAHSHFSHLDYDKKFLLHWTPQEKDIIFEIQAETRGYVGLGFSPNGGMAGADIVTAWVNDNGIPYLQDRHGKGNWVPAIDESQDVKLLAAHQNDTHTLIRFSRLWRSCDAENDFILSDDTMRIIWAMGSEDPAGAESLQIHEQRGTKSLYLRAPIFSLPEFSSDVTAWDLRANNVEVPGNLSTFYWCKIFKVPPIRKKTHIVGFQPIIQSENRDNVHHMVLYECYIEDAALHYERWLDSHGAQCFTRNMPPSWGACSSPIVVWSVGSDGELYPEEAGFPIGERHGAADYFMMEFHYDNPYYKKGIVDSSGLRVFHTEKLRKYDAGVVTVGTLTSRDHVIPPGQKWKTLGHCTADCTNKAVPESGMQVFQVMLHGHLLASHIRLSHIRHGQELQPLAEDNNYDFDYQQARVLRTPTTVYPGDTLLAHCTYDSTALTKPTFGGVSTEEEMCLAFVAHYPRVDLSWCLSVAPLDYLLDLMPGEEGGGSEAMSVNAPPDSNLPRNEYITAPSPDSREQEPKKMRHKSQSTQRLLTSWNTNLDELFVNGWNWSDAVLMEQYQERAYFAPHVTSCTRKNSQKHPGVKSMHSFPEIQTFWEEEVPNCSNEQKVGGHKPTHNEYFLHFEEASATRKEEEEVQGSGGSAVKSLLYLSLVSLLLSCKLRTM